MMRFGSRLSAGLRNADRRLDESMRARGRRPVGGDDSGFVLLESVVAIALITIVMAAFTTFFVGGITSTNHQRARQAAAQIADSSIETIRGLPVDDLAVGHNTVTAISTSPPPVNNISYTVADDLTLPLSPDQFDLCDPDVSTVPQSTTGDRHRHLVGSNVPGIEIRAVHLLDVDPAEPGCRAVSDSLPDPTSDATNDCPRPQQEGLDGW